MDALGNPLYVVSLVVVGEFWVYVLTWAKPKSHTFLEECQVLLINTFVAFVWSVELILVLCKRRFWQTVCFKNFHQRLKVRYFQENCLHTKEFNHSCHSVFALLLEPTFVLVCLRHDLNQLFTYFVGVFLIVKLDLFLRTFDMKLNFIWWKQCSLALIFAVFLVTRWWILVQAFHVIKLTLLLMSFSLNLFPKGGWTGS